MVARYRKHTGTITARRKVFIGGLGALTPVLMSLLVVDLPVILLNLTIFVILGVVLKVIVLFYLGGLIAYLHKDEMSPLKLFELGIVAPALITGLLNARHIEVPQAPPPEAEAAVIALMPTVHAQSAQPQDVKEFSLPRESWIQQIYRGVSSEVPKNIWFVISSLHGNKEEARLRAKEINSIDGFKDFKAEVYAPYNQELPGYSVVIGANLTYEQAERLQQKAIETGFPRSIRLWTFPTKQ